MKEKIVQHLKNLTSVKILAIAFMLFSAFVGIGAFPQFLTNTGTAVTEKKTFAEYIDLIDEQYHGMLSTVLDQPALQNKGTYINFNGFMANAMNQPEMNERIKLKNGYLSSIGTSFEKEKMDEVFTNIQSLYQRQAEQGKQFLFVLAPSKTWKSEEYFPTGYSDTSNTDVTYLLDLLDTNGIPYLDLRNQLDEENIAFEEVFFKTDHHWTPQTGFWAYTKILEKMNEIGAIGPINEFYTRTDNYEFQIYENSFLGSLGKRSGKYYTGIDDFCVITPKFETNISIQIPSIHVDMTGSFEDVAYRKELIGILSENDYFNDNPYGLYGWSDRPLTSWKNKNAATDHKAMLIGDSYGNVPFSLMSLYFSQCEELDMRHFKDDFTEFHTNSNPDVVVLLVQMNSLLVNNTTYPFFRDSE